MAILSGRPLALAAAGVAAAAVTSLGIAAASGQGTAPSPCAGQVSTPGGTAGPAQSGQRADPDDVATDQREDACETDGAGSDDGTQEAPDTDQGEGNEGGD